MSNVTAGTPNGFSESGATFLLRWRGRQEGPYSSAAIEAKLAANQIGLLHEILCDGRWLTLRDYFAEREAALVAERRAREEQEHRERELAERQAREAEDRRQGDLLTEERRKNDLLQSALAERQTQAASVPTQWSARKPHRGGTVLALGIIGLLVCGPLCLCAWVMASNDLREMDAGLMDDSGRSTTAAGRTLGVLGTALWVVGVAAFLIM